MVTQNRLNGRSCLASSATSATASLVLYKLTGTNEPIALFRFFKRTQLGSFTLILGIVLGEEHSTLKREALSAALITTRPSAEHRLKTLAFLTFCVDIRHRNQCRDNRRWSIFCQDVYTKDTNRFL